MIGSWSLFWRIPLWITNVHLCDIHGIWCVLILWHHYYSYVPIVPPWPSQNPFQAAPVSIVREPWSFWWLLWFQEQHHGHFLSVPGISHFSTETWVLLMGGSIYNSQCGCIVRIFFTLYLFIIFCDSWYYNKNEESWHLYVRKLFEYLTFTSSFYDHSTLWGRCPVIPSYSYGKWGTEKSNTFPQSVPIMNSLKWYLDPEFLVLETKSLGICHALRRCTRLAALAESGIFKNSVVPLPSSNLISGLDSM